MSTRAHIHSCARWTIRGILLPLLVVVSAQSAAVPIPASAQPSDELFEVYWEFRYAGLVDAVIGSYYDGEHFYLSLGDLFGSLNLRVEQDPVAGLAHGFYVSPDRPYLLDFQNGQATLDRTPVELDSSSYLAGPLGFYVRPHVLEEVFGLSVELNERQLILVARTDDEMPVVSAYRRRLSRVVRSGATLREPHYPLLYGRNRRALNGGVVGYRLSSTLSATDPLTTLNLRGGGEIAGGDFEVGFDALYASALPPGQQWGLEFDTWRWRYVVQDSPYLTQTNAGLLTSDGLRSFTYAGIAVSNEPVHLEETYGAYPLRLESQPGWEVEVYANGQLLETGATDATGFYTASIPITYGSTNVMVREYGPSGEFRETERRVQVPFTFVPPGSIRYSLFAGRSHFERHDLVQASTAVGVTRWLSARAGFDYVTPDTTWVGERLARVPWASVSARLGPPYILTLQAAPGARYGGSFNAYFPSLATYGIEFYRYDDNYLFNRQRAQHEARLNMLLPLKIGRLPVHLHSNLYERKMQGGQYAFNLTQDVVLQPGALRATLGFRASGMVSDGRVQSSLLRLEPRIGYALARSPAVPAALRGLLLSVRSSYDLHTHEVLGLSTNVSKSLSRYVRIQVDVGQDLRSDITTVTLRAMVSLSRVRTTTSAFASSSGPAAVSQDVSGAVSYDAGTGRLGMADQNWVGRSAATVRLFVDYDGDGRRSESEPFIRNGGIRFQRSVSTRATSEGFVLAHNLLPYEQYSISVDQSRIRNPLWVPRTEAFSFVADPNVHKVIDVPFYVSGEVTGSVLMESSDGRRSVPGLKLHIREIGGTAAWEEAVFSDGSFYKIGLPPGSYEAYVDSAQVRVLGVKSDPPRHRFNIQVTEYGDMVDGLEFVLRKADYEARPVEAAIRETRVIRD